MIRIMVTLLMVSALFGCSALHVSTDGELTGSRPPEAKIKIGDAWYETKLGTYCWSSKNQGRCVDTIGPVEMLKNEKPVPVKPGAEITFVMDYEPQPNRFHVNRISEGKHTEVAVKQNSFQAPAQKGIYYYSYGVWWMDEKEANVAHGDAFYYFVLEVM